MNDAQEESKQAKPKKSARNRTKAQPALVAADLLDSDEEVKQALAASLHAEGVDGAMQEEESDVYLASKDMAACMKDDGDPDTEDDEAE